MAVAAAAAAVAIPVFPVTNLLNHEIPGDVCAMFVWDNREIRSSLADYIQPPAMAPQHPMAALAVPGDLRTCNVVRERVWNTVAALVYWTIHLHNHGFSVDGLLIMDHFCVLHTGHVKGTQQLLNMLVPVADVDHRVGNMAQLATFARQQLYQVPNFGAPVEVFDLLDILSNFTLDKYVLVKSHPALQDEIEKSSLFTQHYGILMSLKDRNPARYATVIGYIEANLNQMNTISNTNMNNLSWICNAVQNLFLHQLMRFSSTPATLHNRIVKFLSNKVKCGNGDVEGCMKVRRNGESHLSQDYCGERGQGTQEAMRAALAVAVYKKPGLANPPANPQSYAVLEPHLDAPFSSYDAEAIADAIMNALSSFPNSDQAEAAARAAAMHVAQEQVIYGQRPPRLQHPPNMTPQNRAHWYAQMTRSHITKYQSQQSDALNAATTAAQNVQAAPHPFAAMNMFDSRDLANMFELMDPRVLCSLHKALFQAHELQRIIWHWDYKAVKLPE